MLVFPRQRGSDCPADDEHGEILAQQGDTRYYRRAVTIVDAEDLGGTMMAKLTELFDEDAAEAWARASAEKSAIVV